MGIKLDYARAKAEAGLHLYLESGHQNSADALSAAISYIKTLTPGLIAEHLRPDSWNPDRRVEQFRKAASEAEEYLWQQHFSSVAFLCDCEFSERDYSRGLYPELSLIQNQAVTEFWSARAEHLAKLDADRSTPVEPDTPEASQPSGAVAVPAAHLVKAGGTWIKDSPRLTTESLRRIEHSKRELLERAVKDISPYSPSHPDFHFREPDIDRCGLRVIDYLCALAEALFDAGAAEYAKCDPQSVNTQDILQSLVLPDVTNQVHRLWDKWWDNLLEMLLDKYKRGGVDQAHSGFFKLYEKYSALDPPESSNVAQLSDRYNEILKAAVNDRIAYWQRDTDERRNEGIWHDPATGEAVALDEPDTIEDHEDPNSEFTIPDWLNQSTGSSSSRRYKTGELDQSEQTDPIWKVEVTQESPIPLTRLNGEITWIDAPTSELDNAFLTSEDQYRVATVTSTERSELRSALEVAFGGPEWPRTNALVEPFRRYAAKVFDVNAAAYRTVIAPEARDSKADLSAMLRDVLKHVCGDEWESSPGEEVIRIDWRHGDGGWRGKEIRVIAGNDADPSCLYHRLIEDAIKYRYRFHAVPPTMIPGDPPGINSPNLEWWQYIGLNGRHNLAMAIKPYLEDRAAHWRLVYGSTLPANPADNESAAPTGVLRQSAQPESGTVVAQTPTPGPASVHKKRGRPTTYDTAAKEAALAVKARGGGGKEVAKALYKTPYPSSQQVKNAPNILKQYLKSANLAPNKS